MRINGHMQYFLTNLNVFSILLMIFVRIGEYILVYYAFAIENKFK